MDRPLDKPDFRERLSAAEARRTVDSLCVCVLATGDRSQSLYYAQSIHQAKDEKRVPCFRPELESPAAVLN